jgi:hypothetical protein
MYKNSDFLDMLFEFSLPLLLVGGVAFAIYSMVKDENHDTDMCRGSMVHALITDIGGCDRLGSCGITAEEKDKGTIIRGMVASYPVKGNEVCLCPSVKIHPVKCNL